MADWEAPSRGLIFHSLMPDTIEYWGELVDGSKLNRYEGLALRGLLGELRRLTEVRDTLDELRDQFGLSDWGLATPTERQREQLHDRTRNFFGAYYGAMSHLNGVVARHSSIFGRVNFTDVGPFLRWMQRSLPALEHKVVAEMETARLFRALLDHPAQFPVYDWGTHVSNDRRTVLVVYFGLNSRSGKAPAGASSRSYFDHPNSDWHFLAPDEVSVTNCVTKLAALIIGRVVEARHGGSSFLAPQSMHRHTIKAIGPWHPEFAPLGLWEEIRAEEKD